MCSGTNKLFKIYWLNLNKSFMWFLPDFLHISLVVNEGNFIKTYHEIFIPIAVNPHLIFSYKMLMIQRLDKLVQYIHFSFHTKSSIMIWSKISKVNCDIYISFYLIIFKSWTPSIDIQTCKHQRKAIFSLIFFAL